MNKLVTDEDSVGAILNSSISVLLKQSSRKHKALRDQCELLQKKITEDEKKAAEAEQKGEVVRNEGRADQYFIIFYHAIDTQQTKLQTLALEQLQRLFSHGFILGKSKANSSLYPPKPTSSSNAEGRLLINVIIDTISECATVKDAQVQLNVIKCLLTAISSVQTAVHDNALLTSVIALYHLYLTANDDVVKIAAKATLTQIHQLIFVRMEHFGQQLRQLESTYVQYVTRNNNKKNKTNTEHNKNNNAESTTTTTTPLNNNKNNDSATSETSNPSSPTSLTSNSPPSPASNGVSSSASTGSIAASGGSSKQPPAVVVPARTRGRCGVCCVCGIPADHYCSQTKDAVCSMNCKLVNLESKDPDMLRNQALRKKLQAQLVTFQRDAYLLFRALLRIAYKSLPTPPEPTAVDSKILSLHLLLSILNYAGPIFRSSPPFIQTVKVDLVNCLLRNSAASAIDAIFSLSSSIFVAVISHFKPYLHKVIGPILGNIYLPYIGSPHSSFEHKYISLTVISKICADPQTLVELFLNYDCDMDSYNTFQDIATFLEKASHASRSEDSIGLTKDEERQVRELALRSLVSCMKVLVHWTTRRAQLAKDQEEAEAAAARLAEQQQRLKKADAAVSDSDDDALSPLGKKVDDTPSSPTAGDSDRGASSPLPSIPGSSFSDKFQQQRQQKLRFDNGVLRFNSKPKAGIKYLQEHGLIGSSPDAVAHFLHTYPGLDKTAIGEYMGDENAYHKQVLYAYVDQMDFRGLLFDEGIRHFVAGFRLPGEAQKIDRMMEKFAEQYHQHNPGVFSIADTAYVLAYSVIMLNVDAHNPNLKVRMTLDQFIKNCRGIDDGKDINPVFLTDIYERITTNEIKMKTENSATAGGGDMKRSTSLDPKSRQSRFLAESQQRIQQAEKILSAGDKKNANADLSNNNNTQQNGALNQLSATIGGSAVSAAPDSADVVAGIHQRHNDTSADRLFYLATDADCDAVKLMFDIMWFLSLATFSMILEESDSDVWIDLCLDGYRLAIKISNELELDTSRLAFVSSLRKFTLLGSSKEMKSKNLAAVKVLLTISHQDGNRLKESWIDVLQCMSEVERLHLVASARPDGDVFRAAATNIPATASSTRLRESDSVNSQAVHRIDSAAIERVFTGSANLNDSAIIDFVMALKQISEIELSNAQQPRVFALQKIVEITSYNMGRIRLVWNRIWAILSEYFIKAGCHPNLQVSIFAIDSIRQLAMKFLEKDELTSYQFQKQFFKPFEVIMLQNTSPDTRELIVQCLHRMIASRVNNIKSGWKAVFVVLGIAAKQNHAVLVNGAFDLLTQIMDAYFTLITESSSDTLDECVNCLVAFGCNSITDVAIKAILRLQNVADYLGQYVTQQQQATPARRLSVDTKTVFDPASGAATPTAIDTHVEISAPEPKPLPLNPHSSSLSGNTAVSLIASQSSTGLRLWFLLLTGLSRLVGDPRLEVRNRALEALFAVLNKHGALFAATTWRHIFHGVLFPIFDDVRHASEQNKTHVLLSRARSGSNAPTPAPAPAPASNPGSGTATPTNISAKPAAARPAAPSSSATPAKTRAAVAAPVDYSWLQTTCYQALNTLVELFHRFHVHVNFLLPELLSLITSCIEGENDDLAKIGLKCLVVLCQLCGSQLTVSNWWLVLDAIMDVLQRLLPYQIQSNSTRILLGLPPNNLIPSAGTGATESRKGSRGSTDTTTDNESTTSTADTATSTSNSAIGNTTPPESNGVAPSPTVSDTNTTSAGTSAASTTSSNASTTASNTPAPNADAITSIPAASTPPSSSSTITNLPVATTSSPVSTTPSPSGPSTTTTTVASTSTPLTSTITLPFSASSVSIRCRTQLLLMDSLYEIVQKYFPVRPTASHPFPILSPIVSSNTPFPAFVDPFHSPIHTQESLAAAAAAGSTEHQSRFNYASTTDGSVDENNDTPLITLDGIKSVSRLIRVSDRRIFGYLTCEQFFFALDILKESQSFTHQFNIDLTLRKKLFNAGFILGEIHNRLPQLFAAEAHANKLTLLLLFQLYKEGYNHNKQQFKVNVLGKPLPSFLQKKTAAISVTISQDESSSGNLPLSPTNADPQQSRDEEIADYDSSVAETERRLLSLIISSLTSYRSKVKSGQFSALESADQIIVSFLDEYQSLAHAEFLRHLPTLYPLIIDLVEDAQADSIRIATRQFLKGPIAQLLPLHQNSS